MRNGASDFLWNYRGDSLTFYQLLDYYETMIDEELTQTFADSPDAPIPMDEEQARFQNDLREIDAKNALMGAEMKVAASIARRIYSKHQGQPGEYEDAAAWEMIEYAGNDYVQEIGQALLYNDWAHLAI